MTRIFCWFAGTALLAMLLVLAWWGWHRVGLGALQLGMVC